MKRIILFLLICILTPCSYADNYKIVEISNANYIRINGKELKKSDVFSGNAKIGWTAENQFIAVKNLSRTESVRKFYRNKLAAQQVLSISAYLLKTGQLNTRDVTIPDISWTSGKNKNKFNEKRIALVIGNSNYEYLKFLENAVPDASSVASKLNEYGFDVGTCFDGNIVEMKNALSRFSEKARGYDIALFYYAGHGIQDKQTNISYMLPLDIDMENVGGSYVSERSYLSALDIRDQMHKAECRANILLFDACRSNVVMRGVETGLFTMEAGPKTLVMYSTANGESAMDRFGSHKNGPFAYAFTKLIQEPGLPLSLFIKNVQLEVKKITHNQQIPSLSGDNLEELFYLSGTTMNQKDNNEAWKSNNADSTIKKNPNAKVVTLPSTAVTLSQSDVQGNNAEGISTAQVEYSSPSFKDIQFILISGKYRSIGSFHEGMAEVENSSGGVGFINENGKEIIKTQYGWANPKFSEGLTFVGYNYTSVSYLKDKTGKTVWTELNSSCRNFSEGLAAVSQNGIDKFIDRTGKTIIQCPNTYTVHDGFHEGLAAVKKNWKYGFIDKTGKEVIACRFDYVSSFHEGYAAIEIDKKMGFINKEGDVIIAPKYDWVTGPHFQDGLALVKKGERYGYIDKKGQEIIPCQFDYAKAFSNGRALVKKNGKYGYIDPTGTIVIPCRFKYAGKFSDGLAPVAEKKLWGYINRDGNLIIPYEYNEASSFSEGIATAQKKGVDVILKIAK